MTAAPNLGLWERLTGGSACIEAIGKERRDTSDDAL